MKKIVVVAALALAVPSVALAAKPPAPTGSHGNAAPKVMYVLRGTLTAFTAATGSSNGSVSILVKSANRHGAALKGQTLTFAVSSSTKAATVTVNDKGIVKVRGPKKLAATDSLAAVLQALTAFQVVDQGATG